MSMPACAASCRHDIAGRGAWQDRDEAAIVEVGRTLLGELVKHDDGARGNGQAPAARLRGEPAVCDPFERFSIVSLVWAPGAETPVHDHQVGAWSASCAARRRRSVSRSIRRAVRSPRAAARPWVREIEVRRNRGDIHQVANARSDGNSISIHVMRISAQCAGAASIRRAAR